MPALELGQGAQQLLGAPSLPLYDDAPGHAVDLHHHHRSDLQFLSKAVQKVIVTVKKLESHSSASGLPLPVHARLLRTFKF